MPENSEGFRPQESENRNAVTTGTKEWLAKNKAAVVRMGSWVAADVAIGSAIAFAPVTQLERAAMVFGGALINLVAGEIITANQRRKNKS